MKKSRIVLLLALITLLLTGIAGAARADQDSPKEMLMERIKNSQPNYFDIYKGFEGSFAISVKDLQGLDDLGAPAKELEGSGLKLDGSLNTLQKKLQVGIAGTYDKKQYKGSVYVDGNKVIFTRDFVDIALLVNPSLLMGVDPGSINEYIYTETPEMEEFWAVFNSADSQKMISVYRDLLLFIVEAVPDKYFSTSGGNIIFSLDSKGLEEVVTSVMLKVVLEQERATDLMADFVLASDPSRSREDLEKEIGGVLGGLSVSGNQAPLGPADIKEALAMLNIEKLVVEMSPDPAGKVAVDLAAEVKDPDFAVGLVLNSDITGSRATELNGQYSLEVAAGGDGNTVEVSYTGEYSQKGGAFKEEDNLVLNMNIEGMEASAAALINVDMKENSSARVDIPALTATNSTDLAGLTAVAEPPAGEAPVSVFLDGKPIRFDVSPYMRDGRVMVPVRNLAEALGCGVAWKDPNQVTITRSDFTIIMFVNESQYISNGQSMSMDIAPEVKKGRNIVPLRFIVEEMGCSVEYDEVTGRVDVYTNR
ncbi:MAG TPA: hypothetical protein DEF36_13070 [Desulfotomaculum sp.]|nr:hypothetical protein [Desulfotomaculum sp.]